MNMEKRYKVIISGGGTGGHIFPAISIANALKTINPGIEILFVGAIGKMEMEKVPAAGYKIEGLPIAGLKRSFSPENLLLPFKIFKSIKMASRIIKKFKPNVIVGVGGFASAPLLWSARVKGIPYLIQEQNSYAGLTNKFLGNGASKICVAFEGMEKFFPKNKILLTGNPIREDILNVKTISREEAIKSFGLDLNKKTILVTGGSLGSRTLNNCVKKWIENYKDSGVQLIWQYGKIYKSEMESFLEAYNDFPVHGCEFISAMNMAFAAADVVITRAGAGTISELAVAGKAVIFVPSPNVAEDHQTHNAMSLANKGAALIVPDNEADEKLMSKALRLLNNSDLINKLEQKIITTAKPHASAQIAKEVIKLIEKNG